MPTRFVAYCDSPAMRDHMMRSGGIICAVLRNHRLHYSDGIGWMVYGTER